MLVEKHFFVGLLMSKGWIVAAKIISLVVTSWLYPEPRCWRASLQNRRPCFLPVFFPCFCKSAWFGVLFAIRDRL